MFCLYRTAVNPYTVFNISLCPLVSDTVKKNGDLDTFKI